VLAAFLTGFVDNLHAHAVASIQNNMTIKESKAPKQVILILQIYDLQ
jgi:hypothetical protein